MGTGSPYKGKPVGQWRGITERLVAKHPLDEKEIVDIVHVAWKGVFRSRLGGPGGFYIGRHIFPKPQMMGFLLHELMALELTSRHPNVWKGGDRAEDKDLVHIKNRRFSIEVKTSSDPRSIYGNRSFAQKAKRRRKEKSGYYLTVNFEKFSNGATSPRVRTIRFGWLDEDDWVGQGSPSGQQSRLPVDVRDNKLKTIYRMPLK